MKKFLAIVMAAAMVMSISVTAFADEIGYNAGDEQVTSTTGELTETEASTTVSGKYSDDTTNTGTIYWVEIKWDVTNAVYTTTGTYTWDPEKLQYTSTAATSTETDGSVTVGVENRSNAAISASVDYADAGSYGSYVDAWTTSAGTETSSATLDSAAVDSNGTEFNYDDTTSVGTAQYESFTGSITVNDPTVLPETLSTIGTVTITISASSTEETETTE